MEKLSELIRQFPGDVFFHNGGKFDILYLLPFLDLSAPLEFSKINHRLASIKFGEATLRDSFLILPVALAKFGAKLKVDYDDFEEGVREKHKERILTYLKADNVELHKAIAVFQEQFGDGPTLANRTFSELRKRGIKPGKTTLNWDAKFRPYYFGGRVQAIKPGEHSGRIFYHDINSAYAYAMTQPHWWGSEYSVEDELPRVGAENCLVEVEATSLGALPLRSENGSLSFPYGLRGVFKCSGWELIAGLETGRVELHNVLKVWQPLELKSFDGYIRHFQKMKDDASKAGDKSRREMAKLFNNGCYGRFCLNPTNFTDNCLAPIGIDPGEDWGEPTSTNFETGLCEYEKPTVLERTPCYNVATGASVTGFVRAYLLRALCGVDRPLYCDTDSIFSHGSGSINVSDTLGSWKLEAEGDYIAIAGKKLYALRTLEEATPEKLKGMSREEIKYRVHEGRFWKTASKGAKLTPAEIIKVCRGETVKWKNDAPTLSVGGKRNLFVERKIQRTNKAGIEFGKTIPMMEEVSV